MKWILSFFVLTVFVGCVSLEPTKMSNEEMQFLQKVMEEPLTFDVPADSIEVVWSRAINFLSNYGDLKIQTVTDYYIDTYNPIPSGTLMNPQKNYAYKINRVKMDKSYQISVSGSANFLNGTWIEENLHLMAYYVRTGNMSMMGLVDVRNKQKNCDKMREIYRNYKK